MFGGGGVCGVADACASAVEYSGYVAADGFAATESGEVGVGVGFVGFPGRKHGFLLCATRCGTDVVFQHHQGGVRADCGGGDWQHGPGACDDGMEPPPDP